MSIRHELKYLISPIDAHVLARRFSTLFARDRHAGTDGSYTVRSLYFDTPDDALLRQNKEGVSRREKWRLRTYGEGGTLRLEKKAKHAGSSEKSSCPLSPEEAQELVNDGRAPLAWESCDHPVKREFHGRQEAYLLRAASVVCYRREAFTYAPGNVRLTIDSHIASSPNPRALLDPGIPLIPIDPGRVLLEVKFDAFLPDIVRAAIETPGAVRSAYSKYALGRRYE